MTKAEQFDKAWRLAFKEKDFSLVDEIYHPDYKALDAYSGMEVNLDADKAVVSTVRDLIVATTPRVLFEDEDFLRIHRYNKQKMQIYLLQIQHLSPIKMGKLLLRNL